MTDRKHADGESPGGEVSIVPADAQKTLEWIAVLAADGLDYRLSLGSAGWTIHVPVDHAARAAGEIELYEASERQERGARIPDEPPGFRFSHDLNASLWAVVFLAGCHVLLGPSGRRTPAVLAGAADTERICAGEWWRTLTALTLHSDGAHLAGNVFGLGVLGYMLSRTFGPGLGWFLVLIAGAAGNAAKAALVSTHHASIGASTAVFAALGLLTGYRGVRTTVAGRGMPQNWGRAWFPVGAGLCMLAMWGANPGTDTVSHLLGFGAGVALAVPFSVSEYAWMKGRLQAFLEWVCVVLLVGSWGLAGMAARNGT